MNPINPAATFQALPRDGGVQETSRNEKEKALHKQVDEFSSMLFAQMVSEMRESGKAEDEENEGIFGGGDSAYMMYLFDQEVAKSLSKQGGSQLTDALYKQLSTKMNVQEERNNKAGGASQGLDSVPSLPSNLGIDNAIQRGLGKTGGMAP